MEVLLQALEIIFEVQSKRGNEKITREKRSFPTYETHFFFPFVWTLLTFKPHNLPISYSF
jgi:hypothetical protein